MPLLTPQYDFHRIEEIPDDFLRQHGIRALLLDVDNTLTGDNSQEVKPEVLDWLERQRQAGLQLFVISNNREARVAPFAGRLGLGYIADAAKKLGVSVKFVDAIHFVKGEGIEKKVDDFAAEVAAQASGK